MQVVAETALFVISDASRRCVFAMGEEATSLCIGSCSGCGRCAHQAAAVSFERLDKSEARRSAQYFGRRSVDESAFDNVFTRLAVGAFVKTCLLQNFLHVEIQTHGSADHDAVMLGIERWQAQIVEQFP